MVGPVGPALGAGRSGRAVGVPGAAAPGPRGANGTTVSHPTPPGGIPSGARHRDRGDRGRPLSTRAYPAGWFGGVPARSTIETFSLSNRHIRVVLPPAGVIVGNGRGRGPESFPVAAPRGPHDRRPTTPPSRRPGSTRPRRRSDGAEPQGREGVRSRCCRLRA